MKYAQFIILIWGIYCHIDADSNSFICEHSAQACEFVIIKSNSLKRTDFVYTTTGKGSVAYKKNDTCIVFPSIPDTLSTKLFSSAIQPFEYKLSTESNLLLFLQDYFSVYTAITSCQVIDYSKNSEGWTIQVIAQYLKSLNDGIPDFSLKYCLLTLSKRGEISLQKWIPIFEDNSDNLLIFEGKRINK